MNERKNKPKSEYLLLIFAWTVVALQYMAIFLLPRLMSLAVSSWTQYLAYASGFLFALGFIGEERIARVDRVLSQNAKSISRAFNDFLLYYLLIGEQEKGERRENAMWYLFAVLDLIMWVVLLTVTLPWLGVDLRSSLAFLKGLKWTRLLIASFVICSIPMAFLPLSKLVDRFITRLVRRKVGSFRFLLNLWFIPVAFLFGWITVPWLFFVLVTWFFLQGFMFIVHCKNRLRLGNVLYVFGLSLIHISEPTRPY